ncbi:DUF262 domain-containing HNH endonuclease family protein [Hymenobacter sp. J193]|uniref:DUF262 domain-containing protein n=1 Tax=Hymenobacter sp. J193 TaxID=2898429 RepID=UPI0021515CA0|nr:DUF262 domain-containing protein [Hymenobacter sp. J193]MCR5888345.1 DUF262 domain-containing HNH endonuclease family protein [Hymenobacter sp. J193]
MTDLFTQQDVATVPLTEYVSWFLDPASLHYSQVQLPPIQRNSVWNIAQVERLWDSLLRGFPIGSLLLAPRAAEQAARPLTSDQQSTGSDAGYFLLDGQQRTRTLLLGFQPSATSRLWVDLDPALRFDNADHNDRKFLLRLLTGHQPWGTRRQNPNEGFHEQEKHEARKQLGDTRRYDYLIFPVEQPGKTMATSWPLDARAPVPLDELIKRCGGWQGPFTYPTWEQLRSLIPGWFSAPEAAPAHLVDLLSALENLLAPQPKSGRPQRSVPLLLHPETITETASTAAENELAPDPMEVLFRRVNAGGTVLEGDEMTYSLLKSSWDQAYDLVSEVINHDKVGYLFPATGVVMAATRLARRQQGHSSDLTPSVSQFRRWLGRSAAAGAGADSEFLSEMIRLLKPAHGQQQGIFTQILEEFCQLSLFNPEAVPVDVGIPRKLLLELNPVLLHPVLSWIHDNLETPTRLEDNRLPILRYLMYLLIVRPDAQKYARLAVKVLSEQPAQSDFPDQAIYCAWLKKADACALPDRSQLTNQLPAHLANGWLNYHDELFGLSEERDGQAADPYHYFRSKFWHRRYLLLWFQRAYLDRWFQGYNPMRQDANDTPYDYDHIVPYSHAVCSGRRTLELEESGEGAKRFTPQRYLYLNSLGNYRAWPAWANRADSNKCHTQKLRYNTPEPLTCEMSQELKLTSSTDFLLASAIPPVDANLWLNAGGRPSHWPLARRQAWMQAVEQRANRLYDDLFSTLNFERWFRAACQPAEQAV